MKKKEGIYYVELSDGRSWCPSLQNRGTRYNVKEYSLKELSDYTIKTRDFIAIDFETATLKGQHPCQIGITVVRDGQIEESFSRYIRPPKNAYDKGCIKVHHITPDVTENEPEFPDVWNDIKQYFENSVVVAHNALFDISVLEKALTYYQLDYPSIKAYTCTNQLLGKMKLDEACWRYGIELKEHHDGACDAKACALLYMKLMAGVKPVHSVDEPFVSQEKRNPSSGMLNMFDAVFEGHKPLRGDVLKQDLSQADPDNPFYDRKVVITGTFEQDRLELARTLKKMGADINNSISRNIHYVLIGEEPGPKKMEKLEQLIFNGFNIRVICQDDLNRILSGEWKPYIVPKKIEKNLDITIEHYERYHLDIEEGENPIASKELFYGKRFAGDFTLFDQMTGNVGAAGDCLSVYPETDMCLLSDATITDLRNGIKDETILYIQNYYNSKKTSVFNFCFISETDVLNYVKHRCKKHGDKQTLSYYNRYLKSMQR